MLFHKICLASMKKWSHKRYPTWIFFVVQCMKRVWRGLWVCPADPWCVTSFKVIQVSWSSHNLLIFYTFIIKSMTANKFFVSKQVTLCSCQYCLQMISLFLSSVKLILFCHSCSWTNHGITIYFLTQLLNKF